MQVTGLVLAFIGWMIAETKFNTENSEMHKRLGIAVMVLGLWQPLNGALRPHPGQKFRKEWQWVHWLFGRGVLVLAFVQLYLGLDR